ncbi:MAG: hypothetical protein JWP57_4535 [Spirosoma sp.]|nr:hypothetical protein [Spirosoma sp.]
MTPGFNTRKSAQIAAFFAREAGGTIAVLKLVKLIYLADRENLELYDFPITGDTLVSMTHGPANSDTLDCINGKAAEHGDWEEFVADRDGHDVRVARPVTDEDLDELSRAELGTLASTWRRFGKMTKYEIRNWTHENLPEWQDPNGSSVPIPYSKIFALFGRSDPVDLERALHSERSLRASFAAAY